MVTPISVSTETLVTVPGIEACSTVLTGHILAIVDIGIAMWPDIVGTTMAFIRADCVLTCPVDTCSGFKTFIDISAVGSAIPSETSVTVTVPCKVLDPAAGMLCTRDILCNDHTTAALESCGAICIDPSRVRGVRIPIGIFTTTLSWRYACTITIQKVITIASAAFKARLSASLCRGAIGTT
jgi:hypothetical protein